MLILLVKLFKVLIWCFHIELEGKKVNETRRFREKKVNKRLSNIFSIKRTERETTKIKIVSRHCLRKKKRDIEKRYIKTF